VHRRIMVVPLRSWRGARRDRATRVFTALPARPNNSSSNPALGRTQKPHVGGRAQSGTRWVGGLQRRSRTFDLRQAGRLFPVSVPGWVPTGPFRVTTRHSAKPVSL
jgi:hypothetical protein